MNRLKITLFGSLEVHLDNQLVTDFESSKVRALLAHLAVESDREHRREKLAGLLWPDWPEKSARANLRNALANLRKAIGDEGAQPPILIITRDALRFNPDHADAVDALKLTRLASQVDPLNTELEQATALYKGPFLEGFTVDASPSFDEWVLLSRQSFQNHFMEVLGELARRCEARGNFEQACNWVRRQLEQEPLDEALHRQLIRLLALKGDRSAAISQFTVCRLALHNELKIEPALETLQLIERVRGGSLSAPHPGKPTPHNLPHPLTHFIGRSRELAAVCDLLLRERMVTICGPGGIGKTRLAIRAAEMLANEYMDNVWYIELAALVDPAMLPQAIISSLGLLPDYDQPRLAVLQDFFSRRQTLLILNNCEQVIGPLAVLVNRLLSSCPHLHVLAASRERLAIRGEHIFRLASLAMITRPEAASLAEIRQSEAVSLFIEHIQAIQPTFQLTSANATVVAKICQALDGLPLALELAAARLNLLTPEQLLSRLDDAAQLLSASRPEAPTQHGSLWAAIDWSYALLSPAEAALLRQTAVFSGGWTLEAAEAVCRPQDGLSVLDLLSSLVDKSLVQIGPPSPDLPGENHFSLLKTIQQFALQKLAAAGEEPADRARHLSYYVDFAEAAYRHIPGPARLEWVARLTADLDNLRAAIGWAYGEGRNPAAGLHIAVALGNRFMPEQGLFDENVRWLTSGLEVFPEIPLPLPLKGKVMIALGQLMNSTFDPAISDYFAQGAEFCREAGAGSEADLCEALSNLAACQFLIQGQPDLAFQTLADAWEIAHQLEINTGQLWQWIPVVSVQSWLLLYSDRLDEAWQSAQRAIDLHSHLGDRLGGCEMLNAQAQIALRQGRHAVARACCEELLALKHAANDKAGYADTYRCLGDHYQSIGDDLESARCYRQSLRLYFPLQAVRLIATSLRYLGAAAARLGSHSDTRRRSVYLPLAACLLSAADAGFRQHGRPQLESSMFQIGEEGDLLQRELSPQDLKHAQERGRQLNLESAVRLALSPDLDEFIPLLE